MREALRGLLSQPTMRRLQRDVATITNATAAREMRIRFIKVLSKTLQKRFSARQSNKPR
jgi:hypothetical protein